MSLELTQVIRVIKSIFGQLYGLGRGEGEAIFSWSILHRETFTLTKRDCVKLSANEALGDFV